MISKTAEYALRAMVFLAQGKPDRYVLASEVASKTNVPARFLSRILRDAVREGLLESCRGIGGGFRLARPPGKILLSEVLRPFDDVIGRSRCPFGQTRCSDDRPCGFHEHWKPVATAYRSMLETTTLEQVDPKGLTRGSGRRRS